MTRWEAIDRRTVLLYIEKGRDRDRIAILEFSESLGEFKGFDFENRVMEVKKRLTADAK